MKLITRTILTTIIISFYLPSQAEIASYSGAFLKSGSGGIAVTESMGCYFNNSFSVLPLDIPDGAVVTGVTTYINNLSSIDDSPTLRIFKSRESTAILILNETYKVVPGFSSVYIPASNLTPIEPKEFIVLYNLNNDLQTGFCGFQVHYENDLIFKAGFD